MFKFSADCKRADFSRPQGLTRLYSLLARLSIVLAVTILPLLTAALVQAEEPQSANQPDEVITTLPGSRAAGAHWAGPYEAEGPKILDTRRATPPAVQDTPPPAPDSLSGSDIVRPKSSRSGIYLDQYWLGTRAWEFYRPRQFYPYGLYGFKPFGTRRFWGGYYTGHGYISAGRGFRKSRPGFRRGHPGFPGHGFKGGGFRRR